jgi:hypothetical protein
MHQTVANVLRVLLHAHPAQNVADADQLVDNSLATAVHVTRCAVSRSLGLTPGEMVFRGDMIMDVPILVDLAVLRDKRQGLVDEATRRENAKRFDFNYTVGQEVYVKEHNPDKLQPRAIGPFPITQVFTNGTAEIQIKPHVVKTIQHSTTDSETLIIFLSYHPMASSLDGKSDDVNSDVARTLMSHD